MKTIKTRSPTKAEHARHVAIIREGLNLEVERLRESRGEWIEENTHRADDTAISIAMLEPPLIATSSFSARATLSI
jgi:hypothetical protein